jgi:hypothetical protein
MSKVKLSSKFIEKVANNPEWVNVARQIIFTNSRAIDEANLKDSEILENMKAICLDKPPSEVIETKEFDQAFINKCVELATLLWEDIDANFKILQEAFVQDFKGESLKNFKQYPNAFTLGCYLKTLNDHLKNLQN